jgi:LacI family transcriptional regulator
MPELKTNAINIDSRRLRSGIRGPTVADVARVAGVSAMTVSRVVNAEPNVAPATGDKVRAAIASLAYVPNAAARSLAGGQQCRIALLHANPSAAYLSEFLMGSLAQASVMDVQLIVEHCDLFEHPEALVRRLSLHRVDAVLLPPPLSDNIALLEALDAAKFPLAQIATGRPVAFAHALTIDDERAAHAMTTHLISIGHRRIAFIAGDANQTASIARRTGYERALDDAHIKADPHLVVQGDFSYRSGLATTETLIALVPRPTAIFASNDDMAAAAIAIAHRHHLDVPRDLSVCGFDDTAMSTTIWPEITTIHQPVAAMAKQATALLADTVRAKGSKRKADFKHIELAFEVTLRASEGPPRNL